MATAISDASTLVSVIIDWNSSVASALGSFISRSYTRIELPSIARSVRSEERTW